MSTLRSALDELRVLDLRGISDDELAVHVDELERTGRIIESERARAIAEVERRGSFTADGHLTLSSWLASRHGVSHSTAAAHVRLSRALEHMPATSAALASAEVSSSAVGLLVSAREDCPEQFAQAEETLVDAARALPVDRLKDTVAYWRQAADAERAAEDEECRFARRELHASPRLDGMVRVQGELDAETGQTLIMALRAAEDAQVRGAHAPDARTPTQRRADALGEICRRWLTQPSGRRSPASARTWS